MVLKQVFKGLVAGLDLMDALLVVGLVSLIGGVAAVYRPAGAIVFGSLCLGVWIRKQGGRR